MQVLSTGGVALHYRFTPGQGAPIVFLNSLGTDLRIWDGVIAQLATDAPVLCLDKRGHGLSDVGDTTMQLLAADVATVMDHLDLSGALVCGVSVGGMIAQGLATSRPDLVSALVLCCTGAKIGDDASWNARIETVHTDGLPAMSDAILQRWFSPGFHTAQSDMLAVYRNMLTRTASAGYSDVCAAIRDADFTQITPRITVPTHCIAGADDLATPPALVAQLAAMIPGATLQTLDNCGHLPCIEAPDLIAQAIARIYAGLV